MAGKGKTAKEAVKLVESRRNDERVMTRKRSRSRGEDAAVAIPSPGQTKTKQPKISKDNAKNIGKRAARRINFNNEVGNEATNGRNNNATPTKEIASHDSGQDNKRGKTKSRYDTKHAKSNPEVVDPRYNDGVDVNVDSDESDDFGTEPDDSDAELDAGPVQIGQTNENAQIAVPEAEGGNYGRFLKETGLEKVFDQLMDKKLAAAKQEWLKEQQSSNTGTAKQSNANVNYDRINDKFNNVAINKSPSDTTLYTPALRRATVDENGKFTSPNGRNDLIDKVSQFVESIRVSSRDREEAGPSGEQDNGAQDREHDQEYEDAKKRAERAIIEAEKYKAVISEPPGEQGELNGSNFQVGTGLTDDDFFHLTCHIDPGLVAKIEKGEFVDLDKLLPKDRKRKVDDNRMEWVHSDGGTFLVPAADRMNKITNFRRWDQAFRIYATIYCGAQPRKAREVWQYISVISTAASTFVWENVYDYDITFRHLMAFNPDRSWAVTYNQMWNLCMKEHLPPRQKLCTKGLRKFCFRRWRGKVSGCNSCEQW